MSFKQKKRSRSRQSARRSASTTKSCCLIAFLYPFLVVQELASKASISINFHPWSIYSTWSFLEIEMKPLFESHSFLYTCFALLRSTYSATHEMKCLYTKVKRVKKLKWVADGVKHSVSLLWIWYDALHFLSSSTNRFLEFFYFTKICDLHPTQMHCHCTLIFIIWKYLFDFPSRKILSLCILSISDLIGENPLFRRYNKGFFVSFQNGLWTIHNKIHTKWHVLPLQNIFYQWTQSSNVTNTKVSIEEKMSSA